MSVDKSPLDTYPMRILRVSEQVTPVSADSTYTVLACELLHPSDVDAYAVWLVLCHLPDEQFTPFAVWRAYDRPEGWYFANGEYFRTVAGAVRLYNAEAEPYIVD